MSSIINAKAGGYLTTYEQVNFSTAKMKYSFGKGSRFPALKRFSHGHGMGDIQNDNRPNTFGK
jgi:hypothetical protein